MFYFNFRGLFCKSLISEIDILNKDYYYYYVNANVGVVTSGGLVLMLMQILNMVLVVM